jgi:hypothetical protein
VRSLGLVTRVDTGPWRSFYRLINPVVRLLIRRFGVGGGGDDLLRTLRVRGRTSGRLQEVPVRVTLIGGRRYLIGMFATAQWVKNLRARGEAELVVGPSVEAVEARELHGEEREAVITAYARDPKQASRLRFGLRRDPSELGPEELQEALSPFPVFQVEEALPSQPPPADRLS